MAAPTFDLSGLLLLENTIVAMQAAQTATPSLFTGAQPFSAAFSLLPLPIPPPVTMTTGQLRDRIRALALSIDRLPV
jgi:hypothetical protein